MSGLTATLCELCERIRMSQSQRDTAARVGAARVFDRRDQCPGCAVLHDALGSYVSDTWCDTTDDTETDDSAWLSIYTYSRPGMGGPYALRVQSRFLDLDSWVASAILTAVPTVSFVDNLDYDLVGRRPEDETLPPATNLGDTSGSPQTLQLVQKWLHHCSTHHRTSCGCDDDDENDVDPLLPTRIIDIGNPVDGGTDQIKVLETSGKRGRYMCLSYCWGQAESIQSTTANTTARTRGIPTARLPPVFQDFISVARALGVRYVWIDALCILQDDPKDWAREAARMTAVYTNSYLTVAATGAKNPHEGCFTGLGLTKQSDRLPAIAGLAKIVELVRREEYYAGLWSGSLMADLL